MMVLELTASSEGTSITKMTIVDEDGSMSREQVEVQLAMVGPEWVEMFRRQWSHLK